MRLDTLFPGLSDSYGSWNTICILRLATRRALAFIEVSSRPSKKILPALGLINRSNSIAVVVFPQPLSPMRPSPSPLSMWKLMPSTARTGFRAFARMRARMLDLVSKYFFRPTTSMRCPSVWDLEFGIASPSERICEVARNRTDLSIRLQHRLTLAAHIRSERTTGVERATMRGVDHVWR